MSARSEAPPIRSGFCTPGNPEKSHTRCRKADCPCEHHLEQVELAEGQDPDQPPGISSQTHRLPPAQDAAERVGAFLREFGDGRVDHPAWATPPLFARDLEVLTRAALGGAA